MVYLAWVFTTLKPNVPAVSVSPVPYASVIYYPDALPCVNNSTDVIGHVEI